MQAVQSRPDRAAFPPGPKSSLFNTIRFVRDPYGFFEEQYRRYGDPFTLWTKDGPLVMTADPELVRAIFTVDPDSVDPWGASLLSPFFGPRAVIMVGGERHRRDRKLLTPPFHGSRMRAYGRIIIAVTREQTRGWGAGWEGPVHATTTAISLDVIVRAVFGIDTPGRRERASSIVKKDVESIVPLIAFLPALRREFFGIGPWSRFARARRELDALLYGEITSRRANASGASETGEDILSLILAARYDDGTAMTDDEVHDQLITLLAAGHETTATALAWALYWTHRDSDLASQLRAEIAALGPDPEPDAIAGLPLLDATCTETLRLHPIVHDVSRRLRAPLTLGRYVLPAGTGVGATISAMHANAKVYSNPTVFDAKRFVGNKPPMFGYAPFGGGSRRCLGAAFATYEMKLVLATLLTSFEFELLDRNVVPFRRNITMGPRGGVRMRVVGRRG
ncbi:MAG: cytochrome P450 [Polyangiaceae bacterium]